MVNATLQNATIETATITTANVTTLDLGTNTIEDGAMSGSWDFGGGNLTTTGLLTAGSIFSNGNLDMNSHLITNIGNAGTDFTSFGGLNLAGNLNVNSGNLYVDTATGNVGIGTTSPGAKLHLEGNLKIGGGSATAYTLRFEDNQVTHGRTDFAPTDTWLQFSQIGATTGGANIYGLTDGNLEEALHLRGYFGALSVTDTVPSIILEGGLSDGGTGIAAMASADTILQVRNYTTKLVTVLGNGNVGIGTTEPGARLDIKSPGTADVIRVLNATGNSIFEVSEYSSVGTLGIKNNGTRTILLNGSGSSYFNNGNIGIGTTSPGGKLNVVGSNGTGAGSYYGMITAEDSNGRGLTIGYDSTNDWSWLQSRIVSGAGKPMAFFTNLTSSTNPQMFITNTGNVGIGTTAPNEKLSLNTGRMELTGTVAWPGALTSRAILYPNLVYGVVLAGQGTTYDVALLNSSGNLFFAGMAGTQTAYMPGNVGIGTTAPSAQLHTTGTVRFANFGAGSVSTDANGNLSVSSDERLKNVSGAFTRGLSALLQIDPISYHWKKSSGLDTENLYTGFSAQNVQASIPEAVGVDSRGYLTLSDRPILATAVNAIKELADTSQKFATSLTTLSTTTNQQQTQISGLASQTRDLTITATTLTTLTDQLTDENSSTTDKLLILAAKVEDLEKQLSAANSDAATIATDSAKIKSRLQDLEDQMALLTEGNQAVIDFAKALDTKSLIYKDSVGNLDLGQGKITAQDISLTGTLKAKDIEAQDSIKGATITGKTLKLDSDTSGKAKIISGDTEATIETPEASKDAQIYITPTGALFGKTLYVDQDEIKDGKSFTVKLDGGKDSDPTTKDIPFNWLIIK